MQHRPSLEPCKALHGRPMHSKSNKLSHVTQVNLWGRTFDLTPATAFRPHTQEEYDGLKEAIRKLGRVKDKVVRDEKDRIWDGRHKLLAAWELKLPRDAVQFETLKGMSDEAMFDYAKSLNVHRRHLSPEELAEARKLKYKRIAEKREAGKSYKVIAEEEGVSERQVKRVAEKAGVKPTHSMGKDGRRRRIKPTAKLNSGSGPELSRSETYEEKLTRLQPHIVEFLEMYRESEEEANTAFWRTFAQGTGKTLGTIRGDFNAYRRGT